MLARVPDRRKTSTLGDLGFDSASNPILSLLEVEYRKEAEIFREKDPAEHVYQVKWGAVRSYRLLLDGHRQIGVFHLMGDIFGLENGERHRFTAEAVVDTGVRMIKRESLRAVAETDAVVARNLLT